MALNDKIATALASDMGRVRTNNEDAIAEDRELGLLVLADGMGGYNAGEIASSLTINTVLDVIRSQWKQLTQPHPGSPDPAYSPEGLLLRRAVETAHQTVFHVSQTQPQCAGMGTTVVACLLHDGVMSIAYVGDSRLYRVRDSRLEQLTTDHSLQEELVARGHYTREEASRLVRKNIVTRALGVEAEVAVDLLEVPVTTGDLILLCSDGLTDMVSDEEIATILNLHSADLDLAAKTLVDVALDHGGKDNISVILARANGSFPRGRGWLHRIKQWF